MNTSFLPKSLRYIILGLILSTQLQFGPLEEDAFVNSVFEDIIPKLIEKRDLDGINTHLDQCFTIKSRQKQWLEAYNILVWKLTYADQFDFYNEYCESLTAVDSFLATHQNDLELSAWEAFRRENKLRKGIYYYESGNWLAAKETCLSLLVEMPGQPQHDDRYWRNLATLNQYLGAIARSEGNYEEAEAYYLKGIDCQQQFQDLNEQFRRKALSNKYLGDLFLQKLDFKRSLSHYQTAVSLYDQLVKKGDADQMLAVRNLKGFTTSLLGISKLNQQMGDFKSALQSLQQAEQTGVLTEDLYQRFGEVYLAQKDTNQASIAFQKALETRQRIFGTKHYKTAETYASIGDLYVQKGQIQDGLAQYQQAIIAQCDNFEATDIAQNPEHFNRTFISQTLPALFAKKMDALLLLSAQKGTDQAYLTMAWNTAKAAVSVIDSLKSSPTKSDDDKHRLLAESYSVFEKALHIAARIGPTAGPDAFAIMEKSKSIVLLQAFHNANATHIAGIPDAMLDKELSLKYELNTLEDKLELNRDNDSITRELRTRWNKVKSDYQNLIADFRKNNPDYYQLKYAPTAISVETVRSELLTDGQAILEYFVGDSSVFALTLSKTDLQFKEIKKTFPLAEMVSTLAESIQGGNLSRPDYTAHFNEKAQQFTALASSVYQAVFEPIASNLPKKIILVPDGVLAYVPFDALLVQPVSAGFGDFKTHPYLMQAHEISYAYSIAMLLEIKKKQITTEGVLAMAPVFKDYNGSSNTLGQGVQLDSLIYNQSEAQTVRDAIGQGKVLLGADANKQRFMALAPNFKFVHVATHGVVDQQSGYHSFLAFSQNQQNPDSNRLYLRDLYRLRLHAAMVVLSACKTGIGEMKKGEGIISMAYGMFYSGAQSVVMTLWAVDQSSTTEILRNFYKQLTDKNLDKRSALHAAKSEYLTAQKDPMRAHPFFWAAYTPVGDMRKIGTTPYWVWWIVAISGGLLLGWFFVRTQRNRQVPLQKNAA